MSHRIAELMGRSTGARTKADREQAAKECDSLILRLWKRRTDWPRGWPPPIAAKVLEQLSTSEVDRDSYGFYPAGVVDDGGQTWTDTYPLVVDLQRIELNIWRDAALLEVDVSELKQWFDPHGDDMESGERVALERLISAAENARQRDARASADPKSSDGVATDPVSRLRELEQRRRELLDRVQRRGKQPSARRARKLRATK